MKIGMITDSLGGLSFDEMLKASAELGLEMLEFACGNWSSAPHVDLDQMLESEVARKNFLAKVKDHGLSISALNCSGNPLHPGNKGKLHHEITLKTFQLAKLLKIDRIVMMSGLPGGPGDANPNWIVTDWPPECLSILQYQWDEVIIPYWRELAVEAKKNGIRKICLELHGHQAVYNPFTRYVGSWDTFNLRAGINFRTWDLNLYSNNVFNKFEALGNTGNGRNGCAASPSPFASPACTSFSVYSPFVTQPYQRPREIGVQANYRF